MRPRFLRLLAIGGAFAALMACTSPDRHAGISLDMQHAGDRTPRRFEAELDLGVVALSLRLRWSDAAA